MRGKFRTFLKAIYGSVGVSLFLLAGCTSGSKLNNAIGSLTVPSGSPSPSGTPGPSATPPPGTGGPIKWNPGHYMASNGIFYPGTKITDLSFEWKNLNNEDAILGYRMLITWAALEPQKAMVDSEYDFSQIDAMLAQLKTGFNKPKHLVVVVLPMSFSGYKDGSSIGSAIVPSYIQQDSANGPSNVAGSYGWWGGSGAYTAALWRSNVMSRFIQLHQALGRRYDGDPYFEAIMVQEDSGTVGPAADAGAAAKSGYDDTSMLTQYENFIVQTSPAFSHTNFIFENSYLAYSDGAQKLERFMIDHRVVPGSADTLGQSYIDSIGERLTNWGLEAYAGLTVSGSTYSGPDFRPQIPTMMDVEAPDLGMYVGVHGHVGVGGYSPDDLCAALRQSYASSHAFWTYLVVASDVPTVSQWPNLVKTVTSPSCALTHTGYPALYPQ